jgi:hypothetical protein
MRFNDAQGNPDPSTTVVWAWDHDTPGAVYYQRWGPAGTSAMNATWDCSLKPPPDGPPNLGSCVSLVGES